MSLRDLLFVSQPSCKMHTCSVKHEQVSSETGPVTETAGHMHWLRPKVGTIFLSFLLVVLVPVFMHIKLFKLSFLLFLFNLGILLLFKEDPRFSQKIFTIATAICSDLLSVN